VAEPRNTDEGRAREDGYVLALVHALLGEVGPNLRAVFLRSTAPGLATLWFFLEKEHEEDREGLDDVVDAFRERVGEPVEVDTVVQVDARPGDEVEWPVARPVFARREWELGDDDGDELQ
jgi:hypothetical protein